MRSPALSYELRNTLAPIKNAVAVLERAPSNSAVARRAHGVMSRQLGQLTRLVDDLLDLTRAARNELELRVERFELGECVRRMADHQRPRFQANGVRLDVTLPPEPLFVDGDRDRIAQALGNILDNAARFAGRGARTCVTVSIEGEPPGREAAIHVVDDGAGLAPDLLPRLFRPFAQGDQSLARSQGGLGLGLVLARAIAKRHGGEVAARSDGIGRGTEVALRLPLSEGARGQSDGRAAPAHGRRALIIEDNRDFAWSLRDLLQLTWEPCEVALASSGEEGLRVAGAFRPALVLCDIGLPGRNGYETARAFRSDQAFRRMRLVALTGYARPEDVALAAASGFEWQLTKPVAIEKLESILRAVDRSLAPSGLRPQLANP